MAEQLALCPHCGEFKTPYSKAARRRNLRCIDCQAKYRAEVAMRKAKNNQAARDRFSKKKQIRLRDERRAAKAAAEAAKTAPTPAEQEAAMFAANATAEEKMARAAQAELARRELARRSLLDFILYFEPDYDAGWVHQEICARLEQFVEDIIAGRSPHLIICMPPRHGKQCADSTPVLTTAGWKTHGELVPGDEVFGSDGRPTRVAAVAPPLPCNAEVETTDGATVVCHLDHEWTVYDRSCAAWRTVETRELIAAAVFSGGRARFQLPKRAPLVMPVAELPVAPYALGAWLGDGSAGKPCITHAPAEVEVVERMTACGYAPTKTWEHKDTGVLTTNFAGAFYAAMKLAGLFDSPKHIPVAYQMASIPQREELLAGFIDTDGHVGYDGRVRIATCSDQLRDALVQIIRGLGWRASVYTAMPTTSSSGIAGKKPVHYVGFTPDRPLPTQLPRKRIDGKAGSVRRVGIRAARAVETLELGRCIQVDSEDGMYLVGEHLTPTHNSMIASEYLPAWFLGRHSRKEVIACSYAGSLANQFSRRVQDILREPAYQAIFPGVSLAKGAESVEEWATAVNGKKCRRGGYRSAGVGGPITGKGADLFIVDDPVKNREEAESAVDRLSKKNWFTSTAYTRLMPGGGMLIILTRWHDDDLAGWQLQQYRDALAELANTGVLPEGTIEWDEINYPAIAIADETNRKKGEALHPSRYPLSRLKQIRRTLGPRDWSALFQQSPTAEDGEFFKKTSIRYFHETAPPDLDIYVAGDLSISKKESADWSVFVVAGLDKNDNIYLLDERRGRWDADEIVSEMFSLQDAWNPRAFGVEHGAIWEAIKPHFDKRVREERRYACQVEDLHVKGRDKELRARPIQGRMAQGKVLFPDNALWVQEFVNELLRFPNGVNDDRVDAVAWIGQMLLTKTYQGDLAQRRQTQKSWKEKLKDYIQGGAVKERTYMAA